MAGSGRRTPDHPRVETLPAGTVLWRVSRDPSGLRFSTSGRQQRFSPLVDVLGVPLPAWYGSSSRTGALFESVFHDVRSSDPAPRVFPNAYGDRIVAQVITARDLRLIDLTSVGLQAIGVSRSALIESTPAQYPWTTAIAQRLLDHAPDAEGLLWTSRAHDRSLCVALVGRPGALPVLELGRELPLAVGVGAGLELLRTTAAEARITVVLPDPGAQSVRSRRAPS